jgi:hypothetical protein
MATQKQKSDVMVKVMNAVADTISLRSKMNQFNVTHDGKRDLNAAFGYNENPSFSDYYRLYTRNGIANRIVKTLPKSCWRDGFFVESDGKNIYEDLFKIFKRNKLIQQLEKADILNRIGEYSVLYIGIPDGLDKNQPIGKIPKNREKEIYFSCYDETNITINRWNTNKLDSRYGMPETYTLTTTNLEDSNIQQQKTGLEVHWTRVIHFAEDSLNNPLSGTPYLKPVFNRFIDYEKVIGGSAEAYFRNALGKIVLETKEGFDDSPISEEIKKDMREAAEEWTNNFRSTLRLMGTTAKSLAIPHNDPMGTINSLYKEFTSYTGYPMRTLTGEGGGQLAGSEDKASYNQLVQDRQDQFCSVILDEFLNRIQMAGLVTLPEDYEVKFPLSDPTTELEQSQISLNRSNSLSALGQAMFNLNLSEGTEKTLIQYVMGENIKISYGDDDNDDNDDNDDEVE